MGEKIANPLNQPQNRMRMEKIHNLPLHVCRIFAVFHGEKFQLFNSLRNTTLDSSGQMSN